MGNVALKAKRDRITAAIVENTLELQVLDALGEVEGVGYIWLSTYSKRVEISPIFYYASSQSRSYTARDVALNVLSALKARGQTPMKANKTFDSSSGKIIFAIPGPIAGWTIAVSGGEPRCDIRKITKTRTVAAVAAVEAVEEHEEEYTTYEIANPEECGAE